MPFDPPLETVEPVAFSSRQTAERLIAELARHGLVCSEIRIEVVGDRGWVGSRVWAHPRWFTAADMSTVFTGNCRVIHRLSRWRAFG